MPIRFLPSAWLTPRLAADARIHLRDDGRGDLHVRYAAQIGGGHKARHVADHAAAEGYNPSTAVELGRDHLPENALGPEQVFSLFTPGIDNLQHLEPSGVQASSRRLQVVCRHDLVAHQRDLPAQVQVAAARP